MAIPKMGTRQQSLFVVSWVALSLSATYACIYKFGTSPDSLAAHHSGDPWNHAMQGDDWIGADGTGKPWVCMTGSRQSPINVPQISSVDRPETRIPSNLRTTWSYPDIVSNGSNVEVINNGHAIQVEWLYAYQGKVKIAVPAEWTSMTTVTSVLGMSPTDNHTYVTATPIQFHFHTLSEHSLGGKYYPLELHIVHKITDLPACAAGCYSVTGVLFELSDGPENKLLNPIWAMMPMREGKINYLPDNASIQLAELIHAWQLRDYVTYEGSLTTPPCTEGLLWHVMTQTQKISQKQWRKYKTAVGLKDCLPKNGTEEGKKKRQQHHRMLLSEEPVVDPNDYTCKVVAYGTNFRATQPLNNRLIKFSHA